MCRRGGRLGGHASSGLAPLLLLLAVVVPSRCVSAICHRGLLAPPPTTSTSAAAWWRDSCRVPQRGPFHLLRRIGGVSVVPDVTLVARVPASISMFLDDSAFDAQILMRYLEESLATVRVLRELFRLIHSSFLVLTHSTYIGPNKSCSTARLTFLMTALAGVFGFSRVRSARISSAAAQHMCLLYAFAATLRARDPAASGSRWSPTPVARKHWDVGKDRLCHTLQTCVIFLTNPRFLTHCRDSV